LIELKNVSVRYPKTTHNALSDINLSIQRREFVCVLGQSGAGKSTFIRCINGLQQPTSGEVFFDNELLSLKDEEQLRLVRREMGMIFQHFNLIPRLTVLQNVLTGVFGYRSSLKNILGWFSKTDIQLAHQVIEDVGLTDFLYRRIERLSGGQKQRVGIARALVQKPKVFLGDEPVASLDPGTANHIFSLLKDLHNRHQLLTIINVHDVSLAKRYATRIVALKDGKLQFDGTPNEFTEQQYHIIYGTHKQ